MKIYLGHSRHYDYENLLYRPIRAATGLSQYDIILPHETTSASNNSRDFYQNLDLFIAEVTYPATGLGIELGWAFDSGTPICCIYQAGAKVSGSLYAVTNQFYEYKDSADLVQLIQRLIGRNKKVAQK